VRYLVTDSTKDYKIYVTVNADTANKKESALTVVSDQPSPPTSTFTSTGLTWPTTASSTRIELMKEYEFTTALKDVYTNIIKEN
jgi:hypothetical protein